MKEKIKEIRNLIFRRYKWILLFICVIGFIELVDEVLEEEILKRDMITYNFISKYLISDFATPIAKFITNFGGVIGIVSIALILFIVIKNKKIGFAIWINLIISGSLNYLLKNILQRPRPEGFRIIEERGFSFPSGHSMVSMAFYGFLIYLIFKNVDNKYIKLISISFLACLVVLIGLSRIYLGVHYFSDVIAGFFVAISYLVVYTSIAKRYMYD